MTLQLAVFSWHSVSSESAGVPSLSSQPISTADGVQHNALKARIEFGNVATHKKGFKNATVRGKFDDKLNFATTDHTTLVRRG